MADTICLVDVDTISLFDADTIDLDCVAVSSPQRHGDRTLSLTGYARVLHAWHRLPH